MVPELLLNSEKNGEYRYAVSIALSPSSSSTVPLQLPHCLSSCRPGWACWDASENILGNTSNCIYQLVIKDLLIRFINLITIYFFYLAGAHILVGYCMILWVDGINPFIWLRETLRPTLQVIALFQQARFCCRSFPIIKQRRLL